MDRLARNLDDLRRIVPGLTERGVHVRFGKGEPDLYRGRFTHVALASECHGSVRTV